MDFIATEPAATDNTTIVNDGWFPDIDLTDVRAVMRLDGTVTEARLRQAVVAAVIDVNDSLTDWKETKLAAGYTAMAAVPAASIDGKSKLLAHYVRAVYSTAKADMVERYRDYDTSINGDKKAEMLDASIDEMRRNAHWAISDIVGRSRTTVELI